MAATDAAPHHRFTVAVIDLQGDLALKVRPSEPVEWLPGWR